MSALFWLRALILKALPSGWSKDLPPRKGVLLCRELPVWGDKGPWLRLRCRGRIPKRRVAVAGPKATEDGACWLPGLGRHCRLVACQSAFPARKHLLTGKTAVCCSGWQSLKPICTSPRRQKTLCSFFWRRPVRTRVFKKPPVRSQFINEHLQAHWRKMRVEDSFLQSRFKHHWRLWVAAPRTRPQRCCQLFAV